MHFYCFLWFFVVFYCFLSFFNKINKVELGNEQNKQIFVKKRPGVDEFLEEMSHIFEIIVFTSSMEEYAGAVMDLLDPLQRVKIRLFRENCVIHQRKVVKSLNNLQRNLKDIIIIDVNIRKLFVLLLFFKEL